MGDVGDNKANELDHGLSTARVQALADGVFAIAMTLLILEIHLPENINELSDLPFWSMVFAYALSFVALGVFWVGHHNQFHYIKHADRTLLWVNIFYLMVVAFIPFSAGLLGQALQGKYSDSRIPYLFYGANLTLCALVLVLHWRYGITNTKLTHGKVDPELVRTGTRTILRGPVLYLIATASAFISTQLGSVLFLLVSLSYVVPTNIDRHFRGRHHEEVEAPAPDNQATAGQSQS